MKIRTRIVIGCCLLNMLGAFCVTNNLISLDARQWAFGQMICWAGMAVVAIDFYEWGMRTK